LDVPYYVTLEGGRPMLHPPKMPAQPLIAMAPDLFICDGMRILFARMPKGRPSSFLMSGRWNPVRNLRFERADQSEFFLPVHPAQVPKAP
jgi:hypothetical protein